MAADAGDGNDRHARADRLAYEALAPAEDSLIAPAPVAHRVDLASRPDDHVAPGGQRCADALAGGRDHATVAEVVAEAGRGHQDIVSGRMKHALCAESPPPVEDERPGVHRQRPSGMISDQKRVLLRETLPTGSLKPEVVIAEGIPDVLLSAQQFLVGTVEGVFGGRGGALSDHPLDQTRLGLGARAV